MNFIQQSKFLSLAHYNANCHVFDINKAPLMNYKLQEFPCMKYNFIFHSFC